MNEPKKYRSKSMYINAVFPENEPNVVRLHFQGGEKILENREKFLAMFEPIPDTPRPEIMAFAEAMEAYRGAPSKPTEQDLLDLTEILFVGTKQEKLDVLVEISIDCMMLYHRLKEETRRAEREGGNDGH